MDPKTPDSRRKRAIQRAVIEWYDHSHRKLPWRETKSAYHVWVSEIMAQQTRLATVEPYFVKFIKKFPTLRSLAGASEDQVLSAWSGLGYYSRARNLHRTARLVAGQQRGRLPRRAEELIKLPGIGRYTAGAIASIAFGQPEPVLDGNLIRVLARLFDLDWDTGRAANRKLLWDLSGQLVLHANPGRFNEGMMELGALICLPRSPKCRICPLGRLCRARKNGTVALRPVKTGKKPPRSVQYLAALVQDSRGRILLVKNRSPGLFGGLWQFPSLMRPSRSPVRTAPDDLQKALETDLGIPVTVGKRLASLKHVLTHRSLQVRLFACRAGSGRIRKGIYPSSRWIAVDREPAGLALSTLTRKLLVTSLTELKYK